MSNLMNENALCTVLIDGVQTTVAQDATILQAARQAGIDIPTLCYFKGLNDVGSCRICVVEVEGSGRLEAACNTKVREGMVVHTNTPAVRAARIANLELILSKHNSSCTTCVRSDNCELRTLCSKLGVSVEQTEAFTREPWPQDFPLIRDSSKCISCQRCIQVCQNVQATGVWQLAGIGGAAGGASIQIAADSSLAPLSQVGPVSAPAIAQTSCVLCGQCITHCPTGALRERDDTDKVREALADSSKICMIQIAPAVRTAWGISLGLAPEEATVERLAAAMRRLGFDYVFDTSFTADLTIMEEGSELLARLANRENESFPMFTSCCPGWVRFIKAHYPHRVDQLSTAKSPQQMFGAAAKTYWAQQLGVDPANIFVVSIMPCVAKKHECALENMHTTSAGPDVDVVLTTREVDRLVASSFVNVSALSDEQLDGPLGVHTGAGVIFGATGGVMEAALRSAYYLVTGENPAADAFAEVRGEKGWREATFDLAGTPLRIAVASGLGNAKRLMDALDAGEVSYDFVEIMACPGGCVGGGGQPICPGKEMAGKRGGVLYDLDKKNTLRFSHENPSVQAIYSEYYGEPLSEKAHHELHSNHHDWSMPHA